MRAKATVVVVAETPSLAQSVADLLESDGLPVCTVLDPALALTRCMKDPASPVGLVISASNGHHCATAPRWLRGEMGNVPLVVVGSRDASLRSGPQLHVVGLPLVPEAFLLLVHQLMRSPNVPVPVSRPRGRVRLRPPPRQALDVPRPVPLAAADGVPEPPNELASERLGSRVPRSRTRAAGPLSPLLIRLGEWVHRWGNSPTP